MYCTVKGLFLFNRDGVSINFGLNGPVNGKQVKSSICFPNIYN